MVANGVIKCKFEVTGGIVEHSRSGNRPVKFRIEIQRSADDFNILKIQFVHFQGILIDNAGPNQLFLSMIQKIETQLKK